MNAMSQFRTLMAILAIGLGFTLLAYSAAGSSPQSEPQPSANGGNGNCRACHTCDTPTPENRCLPTCTRTVSPATPSGTAPDMVLLGILSDIYLPVPFDHKGHADMAQMSRGCATCHHHTPEGSAHPACRSCHAVSSDESDIRKPGLKGAYHRQCLNCHREWSHETKCGVCHLSRAGSSGEASAWEPTRDDIVGRMHPPIPEPSGDFYRNQVESTGEARILFRHAEHTRRFGLTCVECHHEDSCSRCHDGQNRAAIAARAPQEHHQPCLKCHDVARDTGCGKCHLEPGRAIPGRFDHATTGFALKVYHEPVSCRKCHRELPFSRLDRDCSTCHSSWSVQNFDHTKTGQLLDANHSRQDCDVCHKDRKFDRAPVCNECHEAAEGIEFPAKRPGPLGAKK